MKRFLPVLHVCVAVAAVLFAVRFFQAPRGAALPDYGEVPEFRLVDASGKSVTRADLSGRPWVADFIFTRCRGQCLVMNAQTRDFSAVAKGVPFVSFTADPSHDTPEVLTGYAGREAPGAAHWRFLTGEKSELERVSVGMHFGALGDPMMHSTRFVLVDGRHRIRGYYDSNDPDSLESLKRDAISLSKGVSR